MKRCSSASEDALKGKTWNERADMHTKITYTPHITAADSMSLQKDIKPIQGKAIKWKLKAWI